MALAGESSTEHSAVEVMMAVATCQNRILQPIYRSTIGIALAVCHKLKKTMLEQPSVAIRIG